MKRIILIPLLLSTLIFSSNGSAECVEGNCRDGVGIYKYSNGDTYNGEFKNGLRHGYGTNTTFYGDKKNGVYENNIYIRTLSEVEEKRKADAIKAEQEREDKKRSEKIYNACYLDKGNDVDMTVSGNRAAVRKLCRGIANDPSFLERWKYE